MEYLIIGEYKDGTYRHVVAEFASLEEACEECELLNKEEEETFDPEKGERIFYFVEEI